MDATKILNKLVGKKDLTSQEINFFLVNSTFYIFGGWSN
jgi:hypothetical protein